MNFERKNWSSFLQFHPLVPMLGDPQVLQIASPHFNECEGDLNGDEQF
jgi:hypothetical protein